MSLLDSQPSGQAWQAYTPLEPIHEGEELLHFDSVAPQDGTSLPQPSLDSGKGKEPLYPAPENGESPDPAPASPVSPEDEDAVIEEPIHEPLSYVPAPASVSPML